MAEPVVLDKAHWAPSMAKGDPVLFVHIPAGWRHGPLSHEVCGESFRQAGEFFARHFPEQAFRGFVTVSWLLDGQLAEHLPGESNIVRFLRRFYLLPLAGTDDAQFTERVFGGPVDDWDAAPQDTSLRRMAVAHVRAGGRWRCGSGFRLWADLDAPADVYHRPRETCP